MTMAASHRTSDPLARYRALLSDHSSLVAPRLTKLRRQVDHAMTELRRLERQNVRDQQRALDALQRRLRTDARFLLKGPELPAFVERVTTPPTWAPPGLVPTPPRDLRRWQLAQLPHALELLSGSRRTEPGFEGEHDCLRSVLETRLRLGPVEATATSEEWRSSLVDGRHDNDLFCRFQTLALDLAEQLAPLDLDLDTSRALGGELALLALFTAPILTQTPTAAVFSYP
jgi:hypothetical protein